MTKVILYNAVSVDSFIATLDGDSNWAEDAAQFTELAQSCGCIVVGRKTFEQYQGDVYPVDGVKHIILTHVAKAGADNVVYVTSVDEALEQARAWNIERLMLVGGSKTNEAFAAAGKIDEIIVSIHPLLLGAGMPILGDYGEPLRLRLMSTQLIADSLVQNHYEVVKS